MSEAEADKFAPTSLPQGAADEAGQMIPTRRLMNNGPECWGIMHCDVRLVRSQA
jgi:hypothetical protein